MSHEEMPKQEADCILQVEHLKKYFPLGKNFLGKPQSYLRAVDDVSFRVKRGSTVGIVGESGCGKTTLGRTIMRLYDVTEGRVLFDGMDLATLDKKQLRAMRPRLQMIFQDPYSSLSPRMPVGEIIGEAVRVHHIVPPAQHIMEECGLPAHYYERYPHEFSGGQRQRICIARSLALQPSLIICDEPVSALDVSIQAQIINLLKDLQEKQNLSYIFISHDLSVVKHISDEVGVMYLGSLVEYAPVKEIFDNPLHPYTQALLSAVPVPDPDAERHRKILSGDIPSPAAPPSGCKFHTRCDHCTEGCKEGAPELREVSPGHFVSCKLFSQ